MMIEIHPDDDWHDIKYSPGERELGTRTTSFLNAPSPATILTIIRVINQQSYCHHHLANWSPDASLGVSALPQVILLKPLPSVLKSCEGLHHGEVGGKLEDVLGEALLGDSSTAFLWHFTQPAGESSSYSYSTSSPTLSFPSILIVVAISTCMRILPCGCLSSARRPPAPTRSPTPW